MVADEHVELREAVHGQPAGYPRLRELVRGEAHHGQREQDEAPQEKEHLWRAVIGARTSSP